MIEELDNSYTLNFVKRLDNDNLKNLSPLLIEEKAVIAGSYVLQSVLNKNWANDVDIWCSDPDMKNITKKLRDLGYVLVNTRKVDRQIGFKLISDIDRILKNKYSVATESQINDFKARQENLIQYNNNVLRSIESEYFRLRECIETIYTFKHESNFTIQLMKTKGSHIDCINKFDFNICRVYYDGENVMVINKKDFLSSIENKICKITKEAVESQSASEWFRTLKRAIKYTNRGFFVDFRLAYEKIKEFATNDDEKNVRIRFTTNWNFSLITYDIPKTLLIPYFHSYYGIKDFDINNVGRQIFAEDEKGRNIIFGYNINPANTLPKNIKKITKFRLFDIHNRVDPFIPYISKENAKNRAKQDDVQNLDLPEDIKTHISGMFGKKKKDTELFCDLLVNYCKNINNSEIRKKIVKKILKIEMDLDTTRLKEFLQNMENNVPEKIFNETKDRTIYAILDWLKPCKKQFEEVQKMLKVPKVEPINISDFRSQIFSIPNNTVIKLSKNREHVYLVKENDFLYTTEQEENKLNLKDTIPLDKVFYDYIGEGYIMTTFENTEEKVKEEKDDTDIQNSISQVIYRKIKPEIPKVEYIKFYDAYKMLFPNTKPSELTEYEIKEIKELLQSGKEIPEFGERKERRERRERKEREEKYEEPALFDEDDFAIPALHRADGFVDNLFLIMSRDREIDRGMFQRVFNRLEENGIINRDMNPEEIIELLNDDLEMEQRLHVIFNELDPRIGINFDEFDDFVGELMGEGLLDFDEMDNDEILDIITQEWNNRH